jgi:hypothetical protein
VDHTLSKDMSPERWVFTEVTPGGILAHPEGRLQILSQ